MPQPNACLRSALSLVFLVGLGGCSTQSGRAGGGSGGGGATGGTGGSGGASGAGTGGADTGGSSGNGDSAPMADGKGEIAQDASPGDAPPGNDAGADRASATDSGGDAPTALSQTPPRGKAAIEPWLAAGYYKSWHCERTVSDPRPNGVHSRNRICNNDLLAGNAGGTYAVGAASIKETYSGTRIIQLTVRLKITASTAADSWYYYAQNEADAVGAPGCVGCHSQAPNYGGHDYVYIQVK